MPLTIRNLQNDNENDNGQNTDMESIIAEQIWNIFPAHTGDVVAFNVVQVSEVTSSNAMEKEGFSRCIELLESKDVTISKIATDRHVTITSCMARNHPHINHQYDVWHLSNIHLTLR
ncbi:uncharacterized protein LOC144641952 [Oculina patagonica]